jgi:glycosyltransferase involved in cell wall biosynthesis
LEYVKLKGFSELMTSKVFLVMTVYNRQDYLPQALDSILNQTYPYWNLTIWDDGSTDSSPSIAHSYAQLDRRIHFISAPHTGRQYALRDAIASHARNYDYLAWVDSDDLLAPDALAATILILDHQPATGMVYTDHWIINEQGKVLGLGARCQIPYSKDRLLIDFMTFHFRLMRREVYDLIGGIDLEFPQAQDYDICLKISEVTGIYHLQRSLYFYRTHPDTISQAQKAKQIERAATAVKNALVRRGFSDRYSLDIHNGDRFRIVRRELHPKSL